MRFIRRIGKRGQSGQSLVILAIGFLALLGFVGIVTDVSVLFIRYSTMRRAVDAAAIAAAGQMRRVQETLITDPGDPGYDPLFPEGIATGQATSIANLNLAARQFIEVYGLEPKTVIVETCGTQLVKRDDDGNAVDDADVPLITEVPDPLNPGETIATPNPASDEETRDRYFELCTSDELKLVRVTAQIDAPTIFLQLLGYPTVTLTESAISQTAVIDVVLIFDVSESMVNETEYSDWDNIPGDVPRGVYYLPPFIHPTTINQNPLGYEKIASLSQNDLNPLIAPGVTPDSVLKDVTIAFEPTTALNVAPGASDWKVYTNAAGSPVSRQEPREFCRVRGYTASSLQLVYPDAALTEAYRNFLDNVYTPGVTTDDFNAQFDIPDYGTPKFLGFVPQYNYYGCCNDPNGDYDFSDLICQPFRDARDAAHGFLDRLDFLRGDRVGFVTFDRQARMIDADGAGPQGVMIETQTDIDDPDNPGDLLRKGADNVLDDVVGVKTDGTGYTDGVLADGSDSDGLWDHLLDGGQAVLEADLMSKHIGDLSDNPVRQSCYFDDASVNPIFLAPEQQLKPGGTPEDEYTTPLLSQVVTVPEWYFQAPYNGVASTYRSYEYRAGCAGTNIGAALQEGSRALYNEGRREGAVWIMVLLSDGAAGASNPITRYDDQDIIPVDPYAITTDVDGVDYYSPLPGQYGPDTTPHFAGAGGYGFYGLCPYGTSAQPSQLLSNDGTSYFPFCSDLKPQKRHFCGTVAISPDLEDGSILDADPNCFQYYDVDDYARDWADWIGIAELNIGSIETSGRVSNQLVPTIFAIGFGINYDTDASTNFTVHTACGVAADYASVELFYNCIRGINQNLTGLTTTQKRVLRDRNADYLGEELLRYIADVGDNNQIDSDYWQLCESVGKDAAFDPAYRPPCRDDGVPPPANQDDRIGNSIDLTSAAANWGARGPCEDEWPSSSPQQDRGNVYDPKPPMTACGNYYVAATGQQLEAVFDQIASRMFTRLSQ